MVSIEFLLTSLVVVLLPGTGVLYTVSVGLMQGFRASFFAALGCTLGIVPHLIASLIGLTTLLHLSAVVFQTIKMVGVLYLFYLAYQMWQAGGSVQLNAQATRLSPRQTMGQGGLINILNPKLSLFFLAFLPQFIPVDTANPVPPLLTLSIIFMLMTLLVFILYGLFAHSVRHTIIHSPRMVTAMQRGFAGLFAFLGIKLATSQLSIVQ